MPTSNEIWDLLTSHGKLERDKGIDVLKEICEESHRKRLNPDEEQSTTTVDPLPGDVIKDIFETLVQFPISSTECPWETKIGILMGCQVV